MKVLVVDIGGTSVKMLATGHEQRRKFLSGPDMTPPQMVANVKRLTADWHYDVVSIGYPGVARHDQVVKEPHNLAAGWVGFDFAAAFGRPVQLINDAAMQALGSYRKGSMLYLGLGTGLGSAMVVEGVLVPLELGHLPYRDRTYEDYVSARARRRHGKGKWQRHVLAVVGHLVDALLPDDVVLGGGNVKRLPELPPGCRAGDNANAFVGGFLLWEAPQSSR